MAAQMTRPVSATWFSWDSEGKKKRGPVAGRARKKALTMEMYAGSRRLSTKFWMTKKNADLATAIVQIASADHPLTLRQLFYRLVSAGHLPSTEPKHYNRLIYLATRLREKNILPRLWIIDHVRATLKPSSWSGLDDFSDSMQRTYRKSLWASQPAYVEILCEKDAIAGTLYRTTYDYDVPLRVCRGYSSVSFAGEIADEWRRISKPIQAYYVGDFDPSGFDIERDLRAKLVRYSGKSFDWTRLAVVEVDFRRFKLLPLAVKPSDTRAAAFLNEHGGRCAEVDALPATELRRRVKAAIELHIDRTQWERLQRVEEAEKQTLADFTARLRTTGSD